MHFSCLRQLNLFFFRCTYSRWNEVNMQGKSFLHSRLQPIYARFSLFFVHGDLDDNLHLHYDVDAIRANDQELSPISSCKNISCTLEIPHNARQLILRLYDIGLEFGDRKHNNKWRKSLIVCIIDSALRREWKIIGQSRPITFWRICFLTKKKSTLFLQNDKNVMTSHNCAQFTMCEKKWMKGSKNCTHRPFHPATAIDGPVILLAGMIRHRAPPFGSLFSLGHPFLTVKYSLIQFISYWFQLSTSAPRSQFLTSCSRSDYIRTWKLGWDLFGCLLRLVSCFRYLFIRSKFNGFTLAVISALCAWAGNQLLHKLHNHHRGCWCLIQTIQQWIQFHWKSEWEVSAWL